MKWLSLSLLFGLWAPMAFAKALCPEPIQVGYDNWPPTITMSLTHRNRCAVMPSRC